MGGSDAGDDEEDAAMAAVATEKMESDEDSDRGSDHSGLKRKPLAMKVSVGWGGSTQRGREGVLVRRMLIWSLGPPLSCSFHPLCCVSNPLWLEVVKESTPSGFSGGKWGSVHVWGSRSCLVLSVRW